jgi:hypothetical protein
MQRRASKERALTRGCLTVFTGADADDGGLICDWRDLVHLAMRWKTP